MSELIHAWMLHSFTAVDLWLDIYMLQAWCSILAGISAGT